MDGKSASSAAAKRGRPVTSFPGLPDRKPQACPEGSGSSPFPPRPEPKCPPGAATRRLHRPMRDGAAAEGGPSPPEPVPGPQRVEGEAGAQPAPSEAGVFKDQASGTQCPGLQMDRFGGSSDPRRGSQGGPSPRQLHKVTPTPVRGLLCKVQQEDKPNTHPPRPSQAAVDLASCPNPPRPPNRCVNLSAFTFLNLLSSV
nr:cuticle collagen dpy-13-like [Manis javanica]